MSKPRIGVVIGSTRPGRFGDKPAEWIASIAKARGDLDVEIVDLRDFPMPFFDEEKSPAWAPSRNEAARAWQKKVAELDGFIITAAEYNRGPTAVLKNALDYAYREWVRKPVSYVDMAGSAARGRSSSSACSRRAADGADAQRRPHRRGATSSQILQQGRKIEEFEHLNQAAAAMLDELAWWASVLKEAREKDGRLAQAA